MVSQKTKHSHKPVHQTGDQPEASQLGEPEAGNSLAHLEIVLEGPVDELQFKVRKD